jgi:hypothetical protein
MPASNRKGTATTQFNQRRFRTKRNATGKVESEQHQPKRPDAVEYGEID